MKKKTNNREKKIKGRKRREWRRKRKRKIKCRRQEERGAGSEASIMHFVISFYVFFPS